MADARLELVKAIIAIEPSGPPFQSTIVKDATQKLEGITDIPMSYDPPADVTIGGKAPLQIHEQLPAMVEHVSYNKSLRGGSNISREYPCC